MGAAARLGLGLDIGPSHFRGGEGTPCFRAIRAAGLRIEPKKVGTRVPTYPGDEWFEGHPKRALHLRYERNRKAVREKKDALRKERGRLECEECGFVPGDRYEGETGDACIEVHHKTPLASLGKRLKKQPEDLICVCANCHRVLRDNGSIYLHCDPTASHYLKAIMDAIFGWRNFENEIVWCYSPGGKSKKGFGRKHDLILRYSKSRQFLFNADAVSIPMTPHKQDRRGTNYGGKMGVDDDGRPYVEKQGTKDSSGNYRYYRYYLDEGKVPEDWWTDINSLQAAAKERTGYPTQKPLALYERIIKASSNEDGIVLDPFAGCATTCVAAERLKRQWVGIDIWEKAPEVIVERLNKEGLFAPQRTRRTPKNQQTYLFASDFHFNSKLPVRTDDNEPAAPALASQGPYQGTGRPQDEQG